MTHHPNQFPIRSGLLPAQIALAGLPSPAGAPIQRQDTGPPAAVLRARPSGWALFCGGVMIVAQTVGLIAMATILYAAVIVAGALTHPGNIDMQSTTTPADSPPAAAVQRAIVSRLGDIYTHLPTQRNPDEAINELIRELSVLIAEHAPSVAFRLIRAAWKPGGTS